MKNKTSYKSAMYRDTSLRGGLWSGKAIDKQTGPAGGGSDYWIADFLLSALKITPRQGTRRLGTALRDAIRKSGIDVKQEIIAAATLAGRLGRETISINEFEQRFNLSPDARDAIGMELKSPRLAAERFQFVAAEFNDLLAFRSTELSNGAMLTAPSANFDDVFKQEIVDAAKREVKFSTQGTVINDKLKPTA